MNLNSLFADGDKQFRFSTFKPFPGIFVPIKLDESHLFNSKPELGEFLDVSSLLLALNAINVPYLGSVFLTC